MLKITPPKKSIRTRIKVQAFLQHMRVKQLCSLPHIAFDPLLQFRAKSFLHQRIAIPIEALSVYVVIYGLFFKIPMDCILISSSWLSEQAAKSYPDNEHIRYLSEYSEYARVQFFEVHKYVGSLALTLFFYICYLTLGPLLLILLGAMLQKVGGRFNIDFLFESEVVAAIIEDDIELLIAQHSDLLRADPEITIKSVFYRTPCQYKLSELAKIAGASNIIKAIQANSIQDTHLPLIFQLLLKALGQIPTDVITDRILPYLTINDILESYKDQSKYSIGYLKYTSQKDALNNYVDTEITRRLNEPLRSDGNNAPLPSLTEHYRLFKNRSTDKKIPDIENQLGPIRDQPRNRLETIN